MCAPGQKERQTQSDLDRLTNIYEAGQTDTQTITNGPGQTDRHEGSRKDTNVSGQTKIDRRTWYCML
jgi:hypothetical protein